MPRRRPDQGLVIHRVCQQLENRYLQDQASGEYRPEDFNPVLDDYFKLH